MNIRTARIIAASEAMIETPNDVEVRKRFCMATFNLDHLAAVIVELSRPQSPSDGSETTKHDWLVPNNESPDQ